MSKPIVQHLDEPCLNCGGTYKPAPQPTAEQRARAADRTEPVPLPPHYDTAPQHVVDELGPLYVCDHCGSGMRGLANTGDGHDEDDASHAAHAPAEPRASAAARGKGEGART